MFGVEFVVCATANEPISGIFMQACSLTVCCMALDSGVKVMQWAFNEPVSMNLSLINSNLNSNMEGGPSINSDIKTKRDLIDYMVDRRK